MRIESSAGYNVSYVDMKFGLGNNQDSQMKSLQSQIKNVQEQLQKLSENEDMSLEEKMKKRKELQQQEQDLNNQFMQRKLEIHKEKQSQESENQKPQTEYKNSNSDNMETSTMQGLISASNAMSQIKITGAVKTRMEGTSRVLKSEIKLDKSRGVSIEHKEAELSELNNRIQSTTKHIMKQVSDINRTLKESKESSKIFEKDTDKTKEKEKKEQVDENDVSIGEAVSQTSGSSSEYRPIDIKL